MARALTWEQAERLYHPNTGRGNYQGDVYHRGANAMLAKVLIAEGHGNEEGIKAKFAHWDLKAWERSEAAIQRMVRAG